MSNFKIPNSREVFLNTLMRELNINAKTDVQNGKIVASAAINKPKPLISLFERIINGEIKVGDKQLHSVRAMSRRIDFFKTDDDITEGVRNLSKSRLEDGEFFVPLAIQLLAADLLVPFTDPLSVDGDYAEVSAVLGAVPVLSGEWFIKHDQKFVTPEFNTGQVFNTNDSSHPGLYRLDTPRIFVEQKRIEVCVELSVDATIDPNAALKVVLWGAGTLPN